MQRHGDPDRRLRGVRATPPRRMRTSTPTAEPIVVKADGLAAGKGVVVAATRAEAHAAIDAMLGERPAAAARASSSRSSSRARRRASSSSATARSVLSLATSQDHKRIGDGDTGPNTGGMGAYSPAPVVTPNVHARVMHEIVAADDRRHGRRRHAVHRLPLRRPDDRRPGRAEDGRVQLPPRRPRDAADPDAPEERPVRPADAGDAHDRPSRSPRSSCSGTAASRSAW